MEDAVGQGYFFFAPPPSAAFFSSAVPMARLVLVASQQDSLRGQLTFALLFTHDSRCVLLGLLILGARQCVFRLL